MDGDNIDHSATNDFQSQITCAIKHNGDICNCINRLFKHIYQLATKSLSRLQNSSNGGFGGSGGCGINNLGSSIGINLRSMKQSKSVSVFNHKKISIDNECVIVMNHCWKMLYDFDCYAMYTAWLFLSNSGTLYPVSDKVKKTFSIFRMLQIFSLIGSLIGFGVNPIVGSLLFTVSIVCLLSLETVVY